MKKHALSIARDLLRLTVGVMTVFLAVNAFDQGRWWILGLVLWLPVNFLVAAVFDERKPGGGNEMAESSTFGSDG